jgi:hypothetical protein
MCWAAVAGVAMAGSSIYSGISQSQANKANARQFDLQAQAANEAAAETDRASNVAVESAGIARATAAANEARQRTVSRVQMGARRVGVGASGFTTEGSPGDVMDFETEQAELDALTIRYSGEIEARDYIEQARSYRAQAKQQRYGAQQAGMAAKQSRTQATAALIGGFLGAGSSLLSSGVKNGWLGGGGGDAPLGPKPGGYVSIGGGEKA